MFERFAKTAVRAVRAAVSTAHHRGDPGIGTEHLLIGLVAHDRELAELVGSPAELTTALDHLDRAALAEVGIDVGVDPIRPPAEARPHRPFTSGAKQVLEAALEEGVALGHRHLAPGHLLLALTRRGPNDSAIRLLDATGVDPDAVRSELLRRLRRSA